MKVIHVFANQVKNSQRFIRDLEDEDFLKTLVSQARGEGRMTILPENSYALWRAQIGFELEKQYVEGEYVNDGPGPFPRERMKPLRDRAREGRANPKGIPYLYLATSKATALSEVRPWLGSLISIAQFRLTRLITIVDCSTDDQPRKIISTSPPHIHVAEEELDQAVWYDIDQAFSKPITAGEETADYAPTQCIAEIFKLAGFDGVAYQSRFGKGHNLALFDVDAADPIIRSLHKVESIEFTFGEETEWRP